MECAPCLETERLLLRPLAERDAPAVYAYSKDECVGRNAGWKPHESEAESREILRAVFIGQSDVFGIERREDGALIGSIGLIGDPKRENDSVRMLGYALGMAYWGRGYMTEAGRAVLQHGFATRGYSLISAYCYPNNDRSRRVIEKLGFEYEGRLAQCEWRYDGAVLDNLCFSLANQTKK